MGPGGTDVVDDSTPEDVAALYRWANLTGAKYRDYSAERREQRARMRYRAARQQLEKELELQAKGAAETGVERVQGARQAAAAARAALRAIEEEREIALAHTSARRKHAAFEQAERQRRERSGPRPGAGEGQAPSGSGTSAATERGSASAEPTTEPTQQSRETDAAIRPAWLGPTTEPAEETIGLADSAPANAVPAARRTAVTETLFDSREQVALRWPALQALARDLRLSAATARMSRSRGPVAAIVSPAGGAGGTSLSAMLARALAKGGERVLLVETAPGSLLPLYFGVGRMEPGELRAVAGREDESGALSILGLDGSLLVLPDATEMHRERMQKDSMEALLRTAQGFDRIVIDLAPGAEWMVRRLAALRPMVLAPIAPEMNSVAGLRAMEQIFAAITDSEGRALLPFYVLNRFDAGLPLHLDIREVLRRELDGRLLPVAVRRSAAVGEALAEGTTVIDYAPHAPVARDYAEVARWLQEAAPASAEALADAARGER